MSSTLQRQGLVLLWCLVADIVMAHDIRIRERKNIEYYVVSGSGVAVQDFIRYPSQIAYRNPTTSLSPDQVTRYISNTSHPSAEKLLSRRARVVCVSGDANFPIVGEEDYIHYGVHGGIFSPYASGAFIKDETSESLERLRKYRDLPIGFFDIDTSTEVIREWSRRVRVGIYRSTAGKIDCASRIAPNVTCRLQDDPVSSAVQFAAMYNQPMDVFLHALDFSMPEKVENSRMVDVFGRWVYPEEVQNAHKLCAVCAVLLRNGINVYYTKGTMIDLPGAKPLDKEHFEEAINRCLLREDDWQVEET